MSTVTPHEVVTAAEVRKALRPVGRIPRFANTFFGVMMTAATAVPFLADGDARGLLVAAPLSVVSAVLAFRVRATLTDDDHLLIRGYVRTTRIDLADVIAFVDTEYEGWWNGFTSGSGWRSGGMWMIDIEFLRRGLSRPETLCWRRQIQRAIHLLNTYADQRSPLSENPSLRTEMSATRVKDDE